jgi:hypothetical protein
MDDAKVYRTRCSRRFAASGVTILRFRRAPARHHRSMRNAPTALIDLPSETRD